MKLICGICEIDDGETLHVYDARSGNPVHAMAITADGETTHVLPINSGDCIVIMPLTAMRDPDMRDVSPDEDTRGASEIY